MTVAVVLFVALLAAAVVGVWSRGRSHRGPLDPALEERWLVNWLLRHPRLGRPALWVDRNVVGGLMLVLALTVVFVAALAVGWLLDAVNSGSGLARWDRSVAEWGSDHATDTSTRVLELLTDLGGTGYLVFVFVAVGVWDYARNRNVHVLLFLAAVLGGVALVNNGLKLLVDRERPDVPHLVGAAGSSFPSGHSAAAAAAWFGLALVISRRWPRRRRAIAAAGAAVVAVSVAASRALLGVHWLTDVIAGLVVGWGWFMLCALVFGGRVQRLGAAAEGVAEVAAMEGSTGRSASLR
jgi:membrane-associated phospholipid phosphatase